MANLKASLKSVRLPPGCGEDLNEPLLYNPYQQAFQDARRSRFCLKCNTTGIMTPNGEFRCAKCGTSHLTNITAPRTFNRFSLLSGRGGGKTLIGAHAVREELMIPESLWWIMGPTYKILHDSTFPTLVRRLAPQWIRRWDPEHMEITLLNGARAAFRSLEDPERARGPHGVSGGWFDEAAQAPVRAYDVFEPTLIKAGGIVIATTTVLGFDWTYDKIEKNAVSGEPGFWSAKWWTEENPLFASNPVMRQQIERARRSMSPEFFAQEYRAERHNAEGLVYNFQILERQFLPNDDAIKKVIPEWPKVDASRQLLIGLDSGADHPFGATLAVVTERGLVFIADYLQRLQAVSQQLTPICQTFSAAVQRAVVAGAQNVRWAANKNEKNLTLEFGLRGIGVIPAESKHEIGIQRVQSWLYSGQMFFAHTARRTYEQMRAYQYAQNLTPTGERKKEQVIKKADELPDCVRYTVMAWPSLPDLKQADMTDSQKERWAALDERARQDVIRVRDYNKRSTDANLAENDPLYPLGSFFGTGDSGDQTGGCELIFS